MMLSHCGCCQLLCPDIPTAGACRFGGWLFDREVKRVTSTAKESVACLRVSVSVSSVFTERTFAADGPRGCDSIGFETLGPGAGMSFDVAVVFVVVH